jgi:hypothetical protein
MLRPVHFLIVLVLPAATAPLAGAETRHVPRDYKSIQAAIDAARAGDVVLVEAGTYRESVRLQKRVTLKSAGDDTPGKVGLKRAEATVLTGSGATARGPGVVLAEGAALDGFTVTGVGVFDRKEYESHHATRGDKLPDDRGAVGAGKDFPAVSIPDVTALVTHCIVRDNGHAGIGCVGTKNASRIIRNVVFRNMGGGIGLADGTKSTVERNRCFNNLRAGIGNRGSAGLILENECFDNVRAGIGIREKARPIVRGNKCYKNRRAGIGCRMEGTAPLLEGNDCYQNGMAGIGCRDGASPLVRGNRCYENVLAGIGSRDGARPIIVGNRCYRNKEAGIGTQLGARAFITHNECYENEGAGIGQRSNAETIVSSNHIHHNKRAGLGFDECKAGKATVISNKVIDNDLVAVGIHGGWKVRLAGNVLARKGGLPPIVMVFKGSEAELCDNVIRGSGVAGVRTEGVVRVVNNTFECPALRKGGGPPQFAVWGLPGSDIVFLGNKVSGWRHALLAEKAAVVASFNQVSDYWQVGIRVNQPSTPVTAIGNVFSSSLGHAGLVVPANQGMVADNRVEKAKAGASPPGKAPR